MSGTILAEAPATSSRTCPITTLQTGLQGAATPLQALLALDTALADIRSRAAGLGLLVGALCFGIFALVLAATPWVSPMATREDALMLLLGCMLGGAVCGMVFYFVRCRAYYADVDALLHRHPVPMGLLDVPAHLLWGYRAAGGVVEASITSVSSGIDAIMVLRSLSNDERVLSLDEFLRVVLDYHFPRGKPQSP